jgi:hypothetical protein
MDIKKLLKSYGKEFQSIYDDALKELESAKEDEIMNLQEYLDSRNVASMPLLRVDFEKEEVKKLEFYRKLNIPEDKIELYMRIYKNFILVEDLNELDEYDKIVIFDLNKESLNKRILYKIKNTVYQLKKQIMEQEKLTEEEIEQYMDSIYKEAKEIVCSDPMTFIIKYPVSTFFRIEDRNIRHRLIKNPKFLLKKDITDVVCLKFINKRMKLLMSIGN